MLNCFSPKLYLGLAPANSGGSVDVRGSGVGATSGAGAAAAKSLVVDYVTAIIER